MAGWKPCPVPGVGVEMSPLCRSWRVYALARIAVVVAVWAGLGVTGCTRSPGLAEGLRATTLAQLAFNRKSTLRLLDEIEKTGTADQALLFRARPDAAPLGWQLMHLAATEDRMGSQAFGKGAPVSREWIVQFSSGKKAGPFVPPAAAVRAYLGKTRAALEKAIRTFDLGRLDSKPQPDARFDFRTSLHVLMYHEPHHHGQAHATFNMFKARHR